MRALTTDPMPVFIDGKPEDVEAALIDFHPADLASALENLDPERAWDILISASRERQAQIFGYFDRDFQTALATITPRGELAEIVMEMRADDRADLYKKLSGKQRDALMPALAQAHREDIRQLASYEEDTAGAIMTSSYVALSLEQTVTEALTALRREAPRSETIYRAYVIDDNRKLLGSVRLKDIITAPAQAVISDIMEFNTHAIRVDENLEKAARSVAHYDMIALPVVDGDNRLVGIITHDDALDVLEAEATDDFHKVGTVTKMVSSVGSATIPMLYRARISWLMLLVFGNIFSGAGIAYYEETIAAYLALMFFLPILIASGGNAGSQSATLMIRALATGDIGMSDWSRVLVRELIVAILLGLSMAAAISVIGIYRAGTEIAFVISISMILIVITGSLIGMLLPFILSHFKLDPATASAPLVTSIADAIGVLIYFSIATQFLSMP